MQITKTKFPVVARRKRGEGLKVTVPSTFDHEVVAVDLA
jgi:hypothetical protein